MPKPGQQCLLVVAKRLVALTLWLLAANAWLMIGCRQAPGRAGSQPEDSRFEWTMQLEAAPWTASYNFQLISLRDTLWAFHPDGTWRSADGKQWQLAPLPNAVQNQAFLDYVTFRDAVYGLGRLHGNIERFNWMPAIFRTTDLRHWDTLTTASNLPPRFFYHPFVFDNKIWIIGGEDAQHNYADSWNSSDGIYWRRVQDSLPFGPRSNSQVVQLNNRLYLLNNDVWSSSDAIHWELETNEIVPGESIFGYTAVVYHDRIWLLGCNRNLQFTSNVLTSKDGKHWNEMPAPWSPRGGVAATVHKNKIYLTGGKYGGADPAAPDATEFVYSRDLWTLEPKE